MALCPQSICRLYTQAIKHCSEFMPPLLDFVCLLQVSIDREFGMSASFFTVLAGAISLGLFIYLFYALLKAEKF